MRGRNLGRSVTAGQARRQADVQRENLRCACAFGGRYGAWKIDWVVSNKVLVTVEAAHSRSSGRAEVGFLNHFVLEGETECCGITPRANRTGRRCWRSCQAYRRDYRSTLKRSITNCTADNWDTGAAGARK